jgi:hypothetical protein
VDSQPNFHARDARPVKVPRAGSTVPLAGLSGKAQTAAVATDAFQCSKGALWSVGARDFAACLTAYFNSESVAGSLDFDQVAIGVPAAES